MSKRLIFSNATPNDQDGIISNSSIIMDRYMKNPVLLKEHQWGCDPLGELTDIRIIDGKYSAIPKFHLETQASREASGMWEKGALKGASIGGAALWKKNKITGEYERDENGYKICEAFYLYEVSLVSLPSNPDAVAEDVELHCHFYEDGGILEEMDRMITTLSSKFKIMPETGTAAPAATTTTTAAQQATTTTAATPTTSGAEPVNLSSGGKATDELPGFMKEIIKNGGAITFSAVPQPKNEPTEQQGTKELGDPQPEPLGLAAKKKLAAMKKLNKAINKAEAALGVLKAKKKEVDEDDEEDEEKMSAFKDAQKAAELASKECAEAEDEYEKACEEAEEEEKERMNSKTKKDAAHASLSASHIQAIREAAIEAVGAGAAKKPEMKSAGDIAKELKLHSGKTFKATVGEESRGITFTRLNSSKATDNDQRLLKQLYNVDKNDKVDLRVHGIVLNSILNDRRLKPVVAKTRMVANVSSDQVEVYKRAAHDPNVHLGADLKHIASDLNAGRIQYWNRADNQMKNMEFFTSTDNALAAPALNTIEWLSLAIFELFPTTSWKSAIPMFGASMASANTGFIWVNITATPTVYKGNSPAPAGDYTYGDTAVSLALVPYWLQPMLWKPLDMHQLRYDQQSTGWAQAFALMNSVIDDNLLYTLASTVPASAIVSTSGISGYQTQAGTFPVGGGNSFYWNNAYAGNLTLPVLNDILAIEQIYRNQNFSLEREKGVLVLDSIGERYLCQDPETKSLLTRFITSNTEEFLGYKHTMFDVRSRVAMYDLATKQVKDFNGAMPATAVSAMLGFIPSQIGMGIGMLDVYMVQDPANYGYRMSADLRIGIVPLRANFYGTTLYTYAAGNV